MSYFLRSINLLNVILVGLVILMTHSTAGPQFYKPFRPMPSKAASKAPGENEPPAGDGKTVTLDYISIAEKNLFHPERKIPVEKTAEEAKPLPKPEFVLYGTTLLSDRSIAYLEDKKAPQSTPGRGKRVSVLAKGESLSGYVLEDVGRESVLMVRGNEKLTVSLNELKERMGGQPPQAAMGGAPAAGQRTRPVPRPRR